MPGGWVALVLMKTGCGWTEKGLKPFRALLCHPQTDSAF